MSLKGAKRYLPHGVVFVSSMGMMIVELVASRLIAKYFGDSLFTWAGIIGVILGGTSLGNFIGGRTADRHRPERAVPVLLLISSVLVFSILLVDLLLGRIVGEVGSIEVTAGYIFRSVLVIAVLFFLPSTALGTISPVMAKYAIESDEHVGNTVGGIYAVSSIGSIAGTFLAGFLLIPLFGIRTIVFVVALVLALLGLTMKGMKVILGTWAALIVLSLLFIPGVTGRVDALAGAAATPEVSGDDSREDRILFADDSPYSYIEVKDENGKRYLVMDGLIHNMHAL
ncbi:MAG TPA: fused MFS/spermidine synthase [Spirochaetia bacterium]|nr:fused MFS/spermidine synthase [Spirochaetia bacterium]